MRRIRNVLADRLFDHLQLFWTGISRDSASVLTEQKQNTTDRMAELTAMREQAETLSQLVRERLNIEKFGRVLDEGWCLKRGLASGITNDGIDRWYEAGRAAGAIGGKLCGAGGGGFLLFVAPPGKHQAVRTALKELKEVSIAFEPVGSQLILPYLD